MLLLEIGVKGHLNTSQFWIYEANISAGNTNQAIVLEIQVK